MSWLVEDSNTGYDERKNNNENTFERSNQAYTNVYLGCHTDLAYMVVDMPHWFVFQCLQAAPINNETFYCDGWHIAEYMKIHYNNEFNILINAPILFRDNQKHVDNGECGWDIFCQQFTIELYQSMKISYNNGVRYSLHWPYVNNINDNNYDSMDYKSDDIYNALQVFGDLTEKNDFRFEYKMGSGNINVFNNYRVLHGGPNAEWR